MEGGSGEKRGMFKVDRTRKVIVVLSRQQLSEGNGIFMCAMSPNTADEVC